MRRLILIIALVAIGFIWAPQVLESAASSCDAFEQKMMARETGGSDLGSSILQNLSGGAIAEEVMKDKHPNLPILLACPLEYWKLTLGME